MVLFGDQAPTEPHWSKTLGGRKIVKSTSARAYNIKMNPYRAPYCINIAPKSARQGCRADVPTATLYFHSHTKSYMENFRKRPHECENHWMIRNRSMSLSGTCRAPVGHMSGIRRKGVLHVWPATIHIIALHMSVRPKQLVHAPGLLCK